VRVGGLPPLRCPAFLKLTAPVCGANLRKVKLYTFVNFGVFVNFGAERSPGAPNLSAGMN